MKIINYIYLPNIDIVVIFSEVYYNRSLLLGSLPYRTTKTKLMTNAKIADDYKNRSIEDS